MNRAGRSWIGGSLLLTSGLVGGARCAAEEPGLDAARRWRAAHGAEILAELAELLSIPNVASDEASIGRNAEQLRVAFQRRGVDVEVWRRSNAPPVVYGRLAAPGVTRTLGLYLHYDGQPVDAARWTFGPWTPTLTTGALADGGVARPWPAKDEPIDPEWRIYGRSSGDDKAPAIALLAALDALAAAGLSPTWNVVMMFEGEEEAGSTSLGAYMDEHREALAVDLWAIFDGPVHQRRRPQLVFGVRGVCGLEITVYGANRELHSGHYGNWSPNPALALAQLLASMKDEEGEVLVDGYYDSVTPLGDLERQALAALPPVDEPLRLELGLAATEGRGESLADRLLRPSLNIRGLSSAGVGQAARNIVPSRATASLDLRLVSGNDPSAMLDLVEAHIRRQGYFIVRDEPDSATRLVHPRLARVVRDEGYPAARTPMDLPVVAPLLLAATAAAGESPLLVPSLGGSLPLYLFNERLAAPAVIAPIANHDDNQHAPDENLRLANLWYGVDLMAALLSAPQATAPPAPAAEPSP